MSFFSKFFGRKPKPPQSDSPSAPVVSSAPSPVDPARDPNLIRVFDGYGREMFIPRETWRDTILADHMKKVWNSADELYPAIAQAISDGFVADMVGPAEHLAEIDGQAERAAALLAITYREAGRTEDSEKVILGHIRKHGESGLLLTHLAKIYAKRGDHDQVARTLWRALELDPNQENAVGWYAAIHHEKEGDGGALRAWRRVAALPQSWRARLWLARDALQGRRLEEALRLYGEALSFAPRPVPVDMLMQMSGDLGNHAHLPELLNLTAPYFDLRYHGLKVGNNLLKANLDLGRLDEARTLLDQLYAQKRPDWKQSLSFWDNELAKAQVSISPAGREEQLKAAILAGDGPVWLPPASVANELFPVAPGERVRIAFLGSTVAMPRTGSGPTHQMSDVPGRLSRAVPLFLAEYVHFHGNASVRTLVPWIESPTPAFMVSSTPWVPADAAHHGRSGNEPCDYVVVTHARGGGETWCIELQLVRSIDQACLATTTCELALSAPERPLMNLAQALLNLLRAQAGLEVDFSPSGYALPTGANFGAYLLRLEQLLATRCASVDGVPTTFLSGARDILDGDLQLCLSEPTNVVVRVLLAEMLARLKKIQPAPVEEFRDQIALLQKEKPLPDPAQSVVQQMFSTVYPPR